MCDNLLGLLTLCCFTVWIYTFFRIGIGVFLLKYYVLRSIWSDFFIPKIMKYFSRTLADNETLLVSRYFWILEIFLIQQLCKQSTPWRDSVFSFSDFQDTRKYWNSTNVQTWNTEFHPYMTTPAGTTDSNSFTPFNKLRISLFSQQ